MSSIQIHLHENQSSGTASSGQYDFLGGHLMMPSGASGITPESNNQILFDPDTNLLLVASGSTSFREILF